MPLAGLDPGVDLRLGFWTCRSLNVRGGVGRFLIMRQERVSGIRARLGCAFGWAALVGMVLSVATGQAIVPEYCVGDGGVVIEGVDGGNPILYDNDWWFDVFDNNYLWAQASLGRARLVGNVVTRDMWDWESGYQYSMEQCMADAEKALVVARNSGLAGVPDMTRGADRVLERPASGRIEDTLVQSTAGSRLIVEEARKASPGRPLVVIAGGPLTTVANALLTEPDIAPNVIVFSLTVSFYGYNGKDGWSAYIVAKRTRLVEWATGSFWERGSVFRPEHFQGLPDNAFCREMQGFIRSDLGMANQLGDGAPLVWLYDPGCWTGARVREAVWKGKAVEFTLAAEGDVLDIPRDQTDLERSRAEFFRVLENPRVYQAAR